MSDDNGNVLTDIAPGSIRRIHLVGVAGTGMGSFAGMLKAAGYEVTGSDENVYPPMSDMLAAWGVQVMTPYSPANLDVARPDLVIIGNVIRRVNPEATAVRERGIPQMSFPAAFGSLVLAEKHSVVVVGTHGKTTTSALMAHVLVDAGTDPSFLVGGVALNGNANFRNGGGPFVVVEGDEYDTAYFDKGPKFLHYQPRTLILTSVEFDHADIYRDLAHYESSFEKRVAQMPADGTIVVSAGWPNAVRLARSSKARVITYSANEDLGAISVDDFLELNEKIGGSNFDSVFTAWKDAGGAGYTGDTRFLAAAARASVRSELAEEALDEADTEFGTDGTAAITRAVPGLPELRDAMSLVWRILLLWLAVLALFVIAGWVA
jgi:UDP-N-acetylmuramate: L-alanyl-gamma-D-glutamyl-meso-diaminopimelate ligase